MSPRPFVSRELAVPARLSGQRLDSILAELFPEHSKAALQKLVRRGGVEVDGRRVLRSNIRPGPRARVRIDSGQREGVPQTYELKVLFEDESIIVVDKPAGLLTHGNENSEGETLSGLAAIRFGRLPMLMGEERPGIVHRLDRETSGVTVLARTADAMNGLRRQFRARGVHKEYVALVRGVPSEGRFKLDWDVGPAEGHHDRQLHFPRGGAKSAETVVQLQESFDDCSLLKCWPRTGRRHQIRVHLHAAGHSILGDKLYGAKNAPGLGPGAPFPEYQCLQATRLAFDHPQSGERVQFESELRGEIRELIAWFRER